MSHHCPLFRQWLCGNRASGLERILCVVLVKEVQESMDRCSGRHDTTEILLKWRQPFPKQTLFLDVCSTSLLKTLWEKEKLLVTSNFSFSHSVFYQFGELSAIFIKLVIVICELFQFRRVENLSFGKGLNTIQSISHFSQQPLETWYGTSSRASTHC